MKKRPKKAMRKKSKKHSHQCFNCKTPFLPDQEPLCLRCRTTLADDFFINLNFVYALSLVGIIANLYLLYPASMGTLTDILNLEGSRTISTLQWLALAILFLMLGVTYFNLFKIRSIAFHRESIRFFGLYLAIMLACFGLVYGVHSLDELSSRTVIGAGILNLSIILGIFNRKYLSRLSGASLSILVFGVTLLMIVLVRASLGVGDTGTNWFFQFPGLAIIGLAGLMIGILLISRRMNIVPKTFGYYNLWTLGITFNTGMFAFYKIFAKRITITNEVLIIIIGLNTLLLVISLTHYAIKRYLDMRFQTILLTIKQHMEDSYRFIKAGEYFYALKAINTSFELNPLHNIDKISGEDDGKRFGGLMKGLNINGKEIPRNIAIGNKKIKLDNFNGNFKGSELAWIKKAELAIIKGNIPEAVKCYKNGIKANPKLGETWLELGNLYASLKGFTGKARKCYEKVLKLKAEAIRRLTKGKLPLRYISWLIVSYLFYEISLRKKSSILGSVAHGNLGEAERLYGKRAYIRGVSGSESREIHASDLTMYEEKKPTFQDKTGKKSKKVDAGLGLKWDDTIGSGMKKKKEGRYSLAAFDSDYSVETHRYKIRTSASNREQAIDGYFRILGEFGIDNISADSDEENVSVPPIKKRKRKKKRGRGPQKKDSNKKASKGKIKKRKGRRKGQKRKIPKDGETRGVEGEYISTPPKKVDEAENEIEQKEKLKETKSKEEGKIKASPRESRGERDNLPKDPEKELEEEKREDAEMETKIIGEDGAAGQMVSKKLEEEVEWAVSESLKEGAGTKGRRKEPSEDFGEPAVDEVEIPEVSREIIKDEVETSEAEPETTGGEVGAREAGTKPIYEVKEKEVSQVLSDTTDTEKQDVSEESPLDELMNLLNVRDLEDEGEL